MIAVLLQASPAARETVYVVQQQPGWQNGVEAFAAVAQIVLAIALLSVGLGILFAALRVKKLMRTLEAQADKLRVDLAPALRNVTAVTENANFVSKAVRKDVERLSETVTAANESLKKASAEAERRVGEFNALIGVVQEEAENLFIGGASAVRGLKAGAETFRRYQTGERDVWDEDDDLEDREFYGDDEDFEDDAEEPEVEVEIRARRRESD